MQVRERGFVTAEEVAKLAGVSRSAVSRTFTDGGSVSEATRKKVMQAADILGYHVNHLARGLSHERSNIVCLVVSDISTPYQAHMLDVTTEKLQSIGRIAVVINTMGDADGVAAAMRQTVNYRAEAVIVLSGTPAPSLISTCLSNGQRVILINRDDQLAGPINIVVENAPAAREAYHLLKRAGCSRPALISSTTGTPSLTAREQAFTAAAAEDGKEVPVMRVGPTGYLTGMEAARQLFGRAATPDGIFCVTDLLAMGCMDVARNEFGLSIPDEISVIGFDDVDQASWSSYNLTTFRQPVERIAEHIATLLSAEDLDIHPDQTKTFEPVPVWRRTVRPRAPR